MRALPVACFAIFSLGCDAKESIESTRRAAEDATAAGQKVVEGSKEALESGKRTIESVEAQTSQQADRVATLYGRLADTGELSHSATAWILERAEQRGGTIEQILVKGTQVAPTALQVARVVDRVVDGETAIEPIYQKVGEGETSASVDAAIGDMPRVEVVDGLTLGIRQLTALDLDRATEERAYLVTWRQDEHIVGFVYRSRRSIDIDQLVKELPPLVRAIQAALKASG